MKIEIIEAPRNPLLLAMAAGRSCYSCTPVRPDSLDGTNAMSFCQDLFRAGHLTVFQHEYFTFLITGVSRLFVWNVLHQTIGYNTEQVSQRYTHTDFNPETACFPSKLEGITEEENLRLHNKIKNHYSMVGENYERMVEILTDEGVGKKAAQEDARYILPVSCLTSLYYTINICTIARIWRRCNVHGRTGEEKAFAFLLRDAIEKRNPELSFIFSKDSDEKSVGSIVQTSDERRQAALSMRFSESGKPSELMAFALAPDVSFIGEESFSTYGDSADAIMESLRMDGTIGSDTPFGLDYGLCSNTLNLVDLKFSNTLSFVSDCQEQRHRTLTQCRPDSLRNTYAGKEVEDYYIPDSVMQSPNALEVFTETMDKTFGLIDSILCEHQEMEWEFLLPACHQFRTIEKGTLGAFQRKWSQRLCFNAQNETRELNLYQYTEFKKECEKRGLEFWKHIGPPCAAGDAVDGVRRCPEGKRCCCSRGRTKPWETWND